MTARRFFLLITATIVYHGAFSQDAGHIRIKGDFANLPDGKKFFLTHVNRENTEDTLQIIVSKSGKVEFEVKGIEIGGYVFVRTQLDSGNKSRDWMLTIVDKPEIGFSGDYKEWPLGIETTSEATIVYRNFYSQVKNHTDSLNELSAKHNTDTAWVRKSSEEIVDFQRTYINEHINSLAAVFLIFERKGFDVKEKSDMYERLSPMAKNSRFGLKLKQQITTLKLKEFYKVGVRIPDYEVELPDGKTKSIRALVSEANYTLIDFWAYWCAPCRKEIPGLKKVYSEFSGKGFNVLGISIDPKRAQWEKALAEINTKWTNVIDMDNISKELFSLDAIPGYILLNQKAEIVAMDIVGLKFADPVLLDNMGINGFNLTGEGLYNVMTKLLGRE